MQTPIWVRGRVPNGYWDVRANRMRYMVWLRKKLGYTKANDWYQLNRQHFLDNDGGGLLATSFKHSPLAALRDYAPHTDWKPWLMSKVPQRFWKDPANRRAYMTWLGKKLRFKKNTDWYKLTKDHFHQNGGDGLLANYYKNSPILAVRDFKPKVAWDEWLFVEAPQRFWHDPVNRGRYMKWLGKTLGYKTADDWCWVKRSDFIKNAGSALLQSGWSPLQLLREAYPDEVWFEWHFYRVPNGFWNKRANRRAYMQWLGQEYCGFTKTTDWAELTREDVRDTGGGTLLTHYFKNSMRRFRAEAARAFNQGKGKTRKRAA